MIQIDYVVGKQELFFSFRHASEVLAKRSGVVLASPLSSALLANSLRVGIESCSFVVSDP